MQHPSVKEKVVFFPVTFEKLDGVIRNGFVPGLNSGVGPRPVGEVYSNQAVAFYPDSEAANQLFQSKHCGNSSKKYPTNKKNPFRSFRNSEPSDSDHVESAGGGVSTSAGGGRGGQGRRG